MTLGSTKTVGGDVSYGTSLTRRRVGALAACWRQLKQTDGMAGRKQKDGLKKTETWPEEEKANFEKKRRK